MTDATDIGREQALFRRCVEQPPSEWQRILDAECDDPALRARILHLLANHRDTTDTDYSLLQLGAEDPARIGPYRVLQRLGEGGMGIVYAAEQREPMRRRVAIKVLRAGYGSREVLARFDVERQALALMNHASIAHIIDAGTTADHRPYIVMEFVAGESITHYCERHNLALVQRLRLFAEVCDAVQHAHQKGVIHRDLKPSNILITEADGHALPKIIDFGIAKATSQRLTEQTLETRVGSLLGTPDYMSPEQAELSPLDVDTRADVYALGAVLYELLTGSPPLQLAASGMTFSELQRAIHEQRPPAPSRRVGGALQRQLRGELDWIVMKALEKQRVHRYASAADLARDLRAHLADEPVLAGPPSRWRALRKFARRHWLASASLASVALTLLVSQLLLLEKNRELVAQRDRANRESAIAQRVTAFTANLFAHANPEVSLSSDVSARQLLDAGVQQLRQPDVEQDPEVRAALLEAAAEAYLGLGAFAEGEALLQQALALRAQGMPEDRAEALYLLASARAELGDFDQSIAHARAALELGAIDALTRTRLRVQLARSLLSLSRLDEAEREALAAQAEAGERGDLAADALLELGRIQVAQGRLDAARAQLEQALELQRLHAGELSEGARQAKQALANALVVGGDAAAAEPLLQSAVDDVRTMYGARHPAVGVALNDLANAVSELPGRMEDAERIYLDALHILVATLGERHQEVGTTHNNLGVLYLFMQQWEKAATHYRAAIEVRREALGARHPETLGAEAGLALALNRLERYAEAAVLLERATAGYIEVLGPRHWRTGNAQHYYGLVLGNLGRNEEGAQQVQEALAALREGLGDRHWRTAGAIATLGRLYAQMGRHADARRELEAARSLLIELFGPGHARVRNVQEQIDALPRAAGEATR